MQSKINSITKNLASRIELQLSFISVSCPQSMLLTADSSAPEFLKEYLGLYTLRRYDEFHNPIYRHTQNDKFVLRRRSFFQEYHEKLVGMRKEIKAWWVSDFSIIHILYGYTANQNML